MKDYLQNREIQIILIVAILSAILVLHQVGAFIVYGVPAITFHTVTQKSPISKSVNILNSFGDWIAYEYYSEGRVSWFDALGVERYSIVALTVKIGVKVEVTDLALSGFLTEISPPPFLIEETNNTLYYKNMTIQSYAYGFTVKVGWTGTAQVSVIKDEQTAPWMIGGPSYQDLHKEAVQRLVPDFNKQCYIAADLLMSIDAPTLASDTAYTLRPDYLGIGGMWLASYEYKGLKPGTGVEGAPSSPSTAIRLFRDKDLTSPCWAPNYDTSMGKPLLTSNETYWLQNLAPQSAWWKTTIIHLGSQLVYDPTKADPDYISWAWEKDGGDFPQYVQAFRVDILFRTTEDWTVPNIPDYQLSPELKEKMKIIILQEPDLISPPVNPPSQDTWFLKLSEIIPIFIVIFVGTIVTIVVYYYAKGKWGVKKA